MTASAVCCCGGRRAKPNSESAASEAVAPDADIKKIYRVTFGGMARQKVRGPEQALRLADPVLGAVIDEVAAHSARPSLEHGPNLPADSYAMLIRGIASQ